MKTVTFNPLTHVVVPICSTDEMSESAMESDDNVECFDDVRYLTSPDLTYSAMVAAAPEYPADAGWISVDERLPNIGQIVDLCINGEVQRETFKFDYLDTFGCSDINFFWSKDEHGNGLIIESGQCWMDRPLPPAPILSTNN